MRKVIAGVTAVALLSMSMLTGCARTTTDVADNTTQHPNGVVYYDANGKLQQADAEAVSPKAQDAWETAGWVAVGAAAVGGLATGIVALTK